MASMDITDELVMAIDELFRNQRKHYRTITQNLSISRAETQTLMMLSRNAPVTMTELADALRVGRSAISRIVQRLTDLNLVVRKAATSDQRRHVVTLSLKGKNLAEKVRAQRLAVLGSWLSKLPAGDQAQLLRILHELNAMAFEERETGSAKSDLPNPALPQK